MNRLTVVFLVLLRLAIGWHFLVEGWHHVHSTLVGKVQPVTGPKQPFSSAGFFRSAPGPFARLMRQQIGDPNDIALGELTVRPGDSAPDRMPPLLKQEWEDYVNRFKAHYQLSDDQKANADKVLAQAESGIVQWLTDEKITEKTPKVTKTYPSGKVEEHRSVPQRIEDYRAALAEWRDALNNRNWLFGSNVSGKELTRLKDNVDRDRKSLTDDLKEKADELLKGPLQQSLTEEQRKDHGALPASEDRLLWWIDRTTEWGLTVIGACLLIGLLTRLNCVLAAGFLFMIYLSAPPFPWLPVLVQTPSHYLYVNEILIEMLAALALATTASGRWFGVDALIHAAFGRRPIPKKV